MRTITKTAALVVASVLGSVGGAWAVPTVGGVTMTQLSGTRQVQVNYNLTGEDAIITLSIETNGVAIPEGAVTRLAGDVCKVVQTGNRSIMWNAGVDWPENLSQTAKARVTAWSMDVPPQVMVINLTGGASADNYPVSYYTSVEALPYGGLTNAIYKSARLVMRKIIHDTFMLGEGSSPSEVTLTTDFYTGVFQVTQGQWNNVMGYNPSGYTEQASRAFRPVENVSYHDVRENPEEGGSSISPNWPESDNVGATSFMGRLRAKTQSNGFDLPTEAQWEFACRAGTTTYFNDGLGGTPTDIDSNAQMDILGRYRANGGWLNGASPWVGCGPENGTAIVGSYVPNAWGLYDTHGNVWELCLDWWGSTVPSGIDPKGAVGGTLRVSRGGSWWGVASLCRSAQRNGVAAVTRSTDGGFRLVKNLP